MAEAENQAELRVGEFEVRLHQGRDCRDIDPVYKEDEINQAKQRQNDFGSARLSPHTGLRGRAGFALDLRTVQNPARSGVEGVTAVHGAAIVP